ncbi:SigE family RNA polymerase sigma factor [Amorphoplanes nipponensis]|uniref:RNA polymerase sigma24 factor n=1 Tax=Actinoplanes nipponensis TaxID=135950 RepID=A0A919JKM7_9ACTN|nr:SigE family RNA polymerase sigma factor [Actinoplanes nipponensis]GIE51152.1 RNA polymerase sigma24 factor [Actinoplanes nipponensis]
MGFEEYVAEQGQSLLRLAYVLTGDAHRAEDLTQTALADAYRHWGRITAARRPDAYVHRMLINAHLDWHRRRSSTERPTDLAGWEPPATIDPAEGIASRDQLRQVLATLPPRARTALILRYYADLDDAGIADAMGVSVSAVRATTSRALATLRGSGVVADLTETS